MNVTKARAGVPTPHLTGDGTQATARTENSVALLAAERNGSFYEQTVRGNMFCFSTAAAGIVMAAAANTNEFCIWNPAGSGVLFVPSKLNWATVSGAAAIAGALQLYTQVGRGRRAQTGQFFFQKMPRLCAFVTLM